MRFLFFFVHPSKFHVFRNTINSLIEKGHHVDILITSKDVLESLLKSEGWKYTNIFPEGRKIKGMPPYLSAAINSFRTVFRLFKYTYKKKYDLFITDDLLVYIGKLKNTPSIVFNDDDLKVVKMFSIVLSMADYCLSPSITDLGRYNRKKIGFDGYKELAYLHPNQFTADRSVLSELNLKNDTYFVVRLVSLRAYHDVGASGLDNAKALSLIILLEKYGQVLISAERELPLEFEKYRMRIEPRKMLHVLAFSSLYIGDSQTMSSEACILGVPSFRLSDFTGKISVMEEKGNKYELMHSYKTNEYAKLLNDIEFLLSSDYKQVYQVRKQKMISQKIDLSSFMTWFFEDYPESIRIMKENPDYQYKFR